MSTWADVSWSLESWTILNNPNIHTVSRDLLTHPQVTQQTKDWLILETISSSDVAHSSSFSSLLVFNANSSKTITIIKKKRIRKEELTQKWSDQEEWPWWLCCWTPWLRSWRWSLWDLLRSDQPPAAQSERQPISQNLITLKKERPFGKKIITFSYKFKFNFLHTN